MVNETNEAHDIGWAVKQMFNGAKVARQGWNGKGMFLFLVPGSRFKVNRPPLLGIYPEGTEVGYLPHVDMKRCREMSFLGCARSLTCSPPTGLPCNRT